MVSTHPLPWLTHPPVLAHHSESCVTGALFKRGKGHTSWKRPQHVAFSSPPSDSQLIYCEAGNSTQTGMGQCLLKSTEHTQNSLSIVACWNHVLCIQVYCQVESSQLRHWTIWLIWHCFKMSEVCSELHENFHTEQCMELTLKCTRC